jgi:RNA 2',3'-cyclic 3'-phosphodiesterase
MIRAFIAVELEATLRRQLAGVQQQLKDRLAAEAPGAVRIAWVKPTSMHLTLKFLGDVDERRVDALRDGMAVAARGHQALRIPLARLGAFPRPQEPRTLWVGPPEVWERGGAAKQLAALVRAMDDCCAAEGVPRETRPFTPHLTLARIKAGERQAGRVLAATGALNQPLALDPLVVDAIVFMRSQLNVDGALHTRLWTVQLTAVS